MRVVDISRQSQSGLRAVIFRAAHPAWARGTSLMTPTGSRSKARGCPRLVRATPGVGVGGRSTLKGLRTELGTQPPQGWHFNPFFPGVARTRRGQPRALLRYAFGVQVLCCYCSRTRSTNLFNTLAVMLLCILIPSSVFSQDTSLRGRTRNPHGPTELACNVCHTSLNWTPLRRSLDFDHDHTAYPLRGLHEGVDCRKCHVSLVFKEVSRECSDCHADLHRAQFGPRCPDCHSVFGWRNSAQTSWDHNNRFPLIQGHAGVDCESCHKGGPTQQFVGLSIECVSCHLADFRSTTVINHEAIRAPSNCRLCHSMVSWSGAHFDHSVTGFPLTGTHATLECMNCHSGSGFGRVTSECASCHLKDFQATTQPNHVSAGFSTNCTTCHTTTGWTPVHFDHSQTGFPLTGVHLTLDCSGCHTASYAGTSKLCESCHLTDYNSAQNPNHVSAGFPHDCSLCHSTSGWQGASFDHSRSRFPLTGAHTAVDCATCHVNNKWTGLDMSCVACHRAQYDATTDPNHRTAAFPVECQVCHQTSGWRPASFNHSLTTFPLTGAHVTVACTSCHVGGLYKGTPQDCYSCHQTEYRAVTDPNHVAAGFPRECGTCHSTSTWSGATFTHKFPIYSGAHRGKWNACLDCHNNASSYAVFTCLNCHEHDRARMDDEHKEIRDYVYNSSNCYSCHPQGRE